MRSQFAPKYHKRNSGMHTASDRVFNYQPKYVKNNRISLAQDSFEDSDNGEYSFDEKEFLNVDENPSRNISDGFKESRTYQPSIPLKTHAYDNIGHPHFPTKSFDKTTKIINHEPSYLKDDQPLYNKLCIISKHEELEERVEFDIHNFSHEDKEIFSQDSDTVSDMDEDLDEGYANQNSISVPEHTPEIGIGDKSDTHRKTPQKQSLSTNVKQKLDLSNFQTEDSKQSFKRYTGGLLSVKNPKYLSQNKPRQQQKSFRKKLSYNTKHSMQRAHQSSRSTSSLVTKSFNDRMMHFERSKYEKLLIQKEEKSSRELKECTFRPKVHPSHHHTLQVSKSVQSFTKPRSVREFLKDQEEHELSKIKHLEEISKEQAQSEQNLFKPKIGKKSRRIGSCDRTKDKCTVYDRLSRLKASRTVCEGNKAHKQSYKNETTGNNRTKYITERLNIESVISEGPNLGRSRSKSKNSKLHDILYKNSFTSKADQSKLKTQLLKSNQSMKMFMKNRNESKSDFTGIHSRSTRSFKHKSEVINTESVSSRLCRNKESYCKRSKLTKNSSSATFKPKHSRKKENILDKRLSEKLKQKRLDAVNRLHNSNETKEKWLKTEKDKIFKNSFKECTFKPHINKAFHKGSKSKFVIKGNDKFEELYLLAKKRKQEREKVETQQQEAIHKHEEAMYKHEEVMQKHNDACMFDHDSLQDTQREYSPRDANVSQPDHSEHVDSNHGSNPELTAGYQQMKSQEHSEYDSLKTEEVKQDEESIDEGEESNSDGKNQDIQQASPTSPIMFNKRDMPKRRAPETPKTEELEEELRDQVLDYQNPIFDNYIKDEDQLQLEEMTNNIFGPQQIHFNNSLGEDVNCATDEDNVDDNPLLFVDVNLGPDKAERIVVFEGDTADDLAHRFSLRHNLNEIMKDRLAQLLEAEISSLGVNN